jgi:hypothetical protein
MHYANGQYARYFNHTHRRVGHVFQGRYKAFLIEENPYFLSSLAYIHANVVRTRACRDLPLDDKIRRLETYSWSSYCFYAGLPVPPELRIVSPRCTAGLLGAQSSDDLSRRFQEFLRAYLARGGEDLFRDLRKRLFWGSDAFGKDLARRARWGEAFGPDVIGRHLWKCPLDVDLLLTKALEVAGIDRRVVERRRRNALHTRDLVIYLCREASNVMLRVLGVQFSVSASAVSAAVHRVVSAADNDPGFGAKVRALLCALRASLQAMVEGPPPEASPAPSPPARTGSLHFAPISLASICWVLVSQFLERRARPRAGPFLPA